MLEHADSQPAQAPTGDISYLSLGVYGLRWLPEKIRWLYSILDCFPVKEALRPTWINLVLYGIRELAYQPNTVTSLECSLHHSARQGVSRLTPDIPVVCPSQDSADQLCSDLIQFLIVQNTLQQIQASSNKNIMSLSCCTVELLSAVLSIVTVYSAFWVVTSEAERPDRAGDLYDL